MASRVAINRLGCTGRSVLTEYPFDVAGIASVTARMTTDTEGDEVFRQEVARGCYQDGLGAVGKPPVSNGIVTGPRASAVGRTPTIVADDLRAVTVEYDNERFSVRQLVRQVLAIPDEARSPR
ncbi:hypothetical protein ACFVFQ_27705 [Streptomyces sp. NPDC057743]|uniref:hypothetical protein n=1 Tax=Streptomyces sp. NPDC057743 TaxID=3346236 RepID=UPI0036BDDEB3